MSCNPRNSTTITDGDGDTEDWVELRNTTGDAIDLTGWRIEDSGAQWPFPAGTIIPANGFLLVWASDKGVLVDPDFPGPAGELHANFQLNGTTDSVTLVNAGSAIVDTISYNLPFAQDESYGRDDGGTFVVFAAGGATPQAPNGIIPSPTPTAAPAPPSIVINEAMQSNTAVIADGDGEFEDWFELFNPTCATVDLTGWSVRDSSESWQLPAATTMAPGGLLFLWASNKGDPDNVAEFPGPAGELHTSFQLAAAGEDVFLLDDLGRLVATVALPASLEDESYGLSAGGTYTTFSTASVSPDALNPGQAVPTCTPTPTSTATSTPAPTPTPGGPTLTPTPTPTITPTAAPTAIPTPTATPLPSATPTPTPAPGVCASAVRINELQAGNDRTIADGDGDFSDWIELFNSTTAPVDLSLWRISDSGNTFVIPTGTSIDANGFLLVWASDKGDPSEPGFPGPSGEVHANFRLSGSGETVSLFDATTCLVDRLSAPALVDEQSFGVTGEGSLGVFEIGYTTPLGPNGKQSTPPRVTCYAPQSPVRLNRIVARNGGLLVDADGDESDFIELLNTGFDPVDLSLWQLRDESDRSIIPDGTVIAGGETLILWASGKSDVLNADYPGPAGEIHLTFRLAGEGEELTFSEPSECIVEQFVYPELLSNQAYGYDEQGQRTIILPGANDASCAAPGSLQIVAISPRNDAGRADEDGEFGDWFELRNSTADELDFSGWVISDDSNTWVVPDGVVAAPDSVVVVWADEKNRGGPAAALHTNFKLGGDGETISVGSSVDCLVDIVAYPALDDDQVYRRVDDASFAIEGSAAAQADDDKPTDPAPGDVSIVGTCIAINEIMAKNDSTLEDDDGEFGDWIELANLSDEPIDLLGYQISDEEDSWTVPDGVEIEAGDFLILWADGSDRGASGEELHTNFKLSSDGEPLTLVDVSGTAVASLSTYPELDDDESFGVDESGDYVSIAAGNATPGEGPTRDGCDFELAATGAAAVADADESDADTASSSEPASSEDLARTGSDTRVQSLLAQVLLASGVTLVVMAKIAHRRSVR